MKVLFITFGDEMIASSRTRVFQYLPHLKHFLSKYNILIYMKNNLRGKRLFVYHFWVMLQILLLCPFYDLIFIQKVFFNRRYMKLFFFFSKIFSKKVVFDFDDAIYTTFQPAVKSSKFMTMEETRKRFNNIITNSNLIILENENVKNYVKQFNSNILTILGPVDSERYVPSGTINKKNIVIGWIGSPSTTMYLKIIYDTLVSISINYPNLCFKTIGADKIKLKGVNMKQVPWKYETEVMELKEFDIGIMPLWDDEWTRGKGGYKLLQYMAIGIPSVTSPVGVNSKIIQDGLNGYLASTEKEWYDKLVDLIENSEKRKIMGENARKITEEKFSLHVAVPMLQRALKNLYELS